MGGPSGAGASLKDVHEAALSMPDVVAGPGSHGYPGPGYRVAGRLFLTFREPRPDAVDPTTGERLDDVILIWVSGVDEKRALVEDPSSPFFTTDHFTGHPSVLVRARDLPLVDASELRELIHDAWLTRAPARARKAWLAQHPIEPLT